MSSTVQWSGLGSSTNGNLIAFAPHTTALKAASTVVTISPGVTLTVTVEVQIGNRWIPLTTLPQQTAPGTETATVNLGDYAHDARNGRLRCEVTGGTVGEAILVLDAA